MVGGRGEGRKDPSGGTGRACCQMDNPSLPERSEFHSGGRCDAGSASQFRVVVSEGSSESEQAAAPLA